MAIFRFGTDKMEKDRVYQVDITKIQTNPYQPRKVFDPQAIEELRLSIQQFGVLQPLLVRRVGEDYELIAGERRLRAAKSAGLTEVPVIFREMSDDDSAVVALIENLQRSDLSFLEEASAFYQLIHIHGMTQEAIAGRIGKNQSTVANKLRLLKLSDAVQALLAENNLTERHARALLKLSDETTQLEVVRRVVAQKLTVQQTEALIEELANEKKEPKAKPKRKKPLVFSKDVRLFVNTINQALETMRKSGVEALAESEEYEDRIEYTIIIPK